MTEGHERILAGEAATAELGEDIAAMLRPGDLVLLRGELGAGKTTLARALVRALAADPALEVPSPTFTLVQHYATRPPLAHFDLYRLGAPDEIDEFGLDEALEQGAALVEWPERAEGRLPPAAIEVTLEDHPGGRLARIAARPEAQERVDRALAIRRFLDHAGFSHARRASLTGDASSRRYERISLPDRPDHLLMDWPERPPGPPVRDGRSYSEIAHLARSVEAFVAVDALLAGAGFAVPAIPAADLAAGLLLISDLGAGSIVEDGRPVPERYEAAAGLLARLHGRQWPDGGTVAPGRIYAVPRLDRAAAMVEAELLIDWYLPYRRGRPAEPAERAAFAAAWAAALDRIEGGEDSLVLRDYHSPNVIWRPALEGDDRLGLIDFQDAVIGPSAYDVASLALDARVTIPVALERQVVAAYVAERERRGPFDRAAFDRAYAVMAAQRNSKILGIFVRLDRRDGKPQYLAHLPRIRDYLARVLVHPALAEVRELYRTLEITEQGA